MKHIYKYVIGLFLILFILHPATAQTVNISG